MTPEQFDEAIVAIGRTPRVRTTTYERVDRADHAGSGQPA
jgi:2-iminoacetate synthase ThiH